MIILLQPIYLKWLGYDSKAVSDEFVSNTSEIIISPNLAIDEKFDNPTLKSEIPESFITIVTPLYTATISNSHLRSNLEKSLSGVSEGNSLAQCLSSVPQIPPMVTQLVASGERSGELENMLSKAADFLDMEFQQSTKIAMNLLEPMVVVIMGTIVASIVVAVLLPLIQMNNLSLIG